MNESTENNKDKSIQQKISFAELFLFIILVGLVIAIAIILVARYQDKIYHFIFPNRIQDFNSLVVENGFHHIQIENGRQWNISYEENHEASFSGTVSHTSPIYETEFAIMSHDILITTLDYSDPELVMTSVTDHHFTWRSLTGTSPKGTINLLHTLPMNDDIFQKLNAIKTGDNVTITGWEIYQIDGYNPAGEYIGTWQDAGCNTTLVTDVVIH